MPEVLDGGRLAVLAGSGDLPHRIFDQCRKDNIDVFAVYFKGQGHIDVPDDIPHHTVKLGQTQKTIDLLKKQNCTHVIFAGGMRRPGLFDIKPDLRTTRIFARLGKGALGDDRLLRTIRAELEGEGFVVIGAQDIIPDLLTPAGVLTDLAPDEQNWSDIRAGWNILEKLGDLDIGQACIMQQGITIGVEAAEGTDSLIRRSGPLLRTGGGGVLVKRSKPRQDNQLDVPTIGEHTVTVAKEAGLKGIAVAAQASQILNQQETLMTANAAGLFVVGVTDEDVHRV